MSKGVTAFPRLLFILYKAFIYLLFQVGYKKVESPILRNSIMFLNFSHKNSGVTVIYNPYNVRFCH